MTRHESVVKEMVARKAAELKEDLKASVGHALSRHAGTFAVEGGLRDRLIAVYAGRCVIKKRFLGLVNPR